MSKEESKKARKKLIADTVMIIFIIISPFIFKLHEYVSSTEGETISFFGLEIDSHGFLNLRVFVWFLLGKLVPLYLLIIWFFTCKHWWYHIILIPIMMYAFQIFEGVYDDDKYIDTENILWLLPICMVIIPFVYFIRIKLYDKYVHGIDLEAMEEELQELRAKKEIRESGNSIDEDNFIEEPESLSDEIDRKLSTRRLESGLKEFQHKIENWLHIKM